MGNFWAVCFYLASHLLTDCNAHGGSRGGGGHHIQCSTRAIKRFNIDEGGDRFTLFGAKKNLSLCACAYRTDVLQPTRVTKF